LLSAAVAVGSVVVLAEVRNGLIDLGDGIVLVGALLVFARAAIGLASDAPTGRRNGKGP
jgi:hypothetical protein